MVKGTTNGTTTGAEGTYSLRLPQATAGTLVLSFIGFVAKEVPVASAVQALQKRVAGVNVTMAGTKPGAKVEERYLLYDPKLNHIIEL